MDKDKKKNCDCNKIAKDLHTMEIEMRKLDFSFLQTKNLCVEIENQSLALYINFLRSLK